jgi:putative flippase GtrA
MPDATAYPGWAFRIEAVRILRFALAGAANTIIGLGIAFGAQWKFDMRPALANACGFAAGILASYVLHQGIVFRDRTTDRGTITRYIVSVALSFVLNQIILELLVRSFPAGETFFAQGVAVMTYTIVLFLLCRFWIFAPMPVPYAYSLSDVPDP